MPSSIKSSTRRAPAKSLRLTSNICIRKKAKRSPLKNYYRPRLESVAKKYENQFAKVSLFTINDEPFGGWTKTQTTHFNDGGVFDKIYKP